MRSLRRRFIKVSSSPIFAGKFALRYTLPVGAYKTLCVDDPNEAASTPSLKREQIVQ
ncbi:hypothetical protein [Desulfosporosinus acididurans]|uniref:hypothetical protein n=1 Tax=Desulfosporosinus acididurans TaxID=476652 RepID=UPI0013793650|nr:hypothetical protein [Desulfosporosinus acididurans]